jgi:replicative DNA helicase
VPEKDFLRIVPRNNIDAERAVLGGILLENEHFELVAEILTSEDFYRASHGRIWWAMETLANVRRPIDAITVADVLKPELEGIGGMGYVAELADRERVLPSLALHHAQIVKDASLQRGLLKVATGIVERLHEAPKNWSPDWTEEQVAVAEYEVASLGANVARKPEPSKGTLLRQAIYNLRHGIELGIETGFAALDDSFGGSRPGHITMVGARTSKGKTAFATNVAINASRPNEEADPPRPGNATAVLVLEQEALEMWERALACEAQVDTFRIHREHRRGMTLRDDDSRFKRLETAAAALEAAPLEIRFRPGLCPRTLRLECKRLRREVGDLKLVIVDYFNLMRGDHHERERWREMQEAIYAIKDIAGELGVPIVLLSQINSEMKHDEKPTLANLRDTGATEEHASNVLLLWQAAPKQPKDIPAYDEWEDFWVTIAKQRNGPAGLDVPIKFKRNVGRFEQFVTCPPKGF